jgi:hypothetical protein
VAARLSETAGRAATRRAEPRPEALALTLLQALAAHAVAEAGRALADAGLDGCPAAESIERIVRALLGVGDRYAVLLREHVEHDPAGADRAIGDPLRAVFVRGIEEGVLRDDLPNEILHRLFGGLLIAATRLVGERRLEVEETAAITTSVFLDGARPVGPGRAAKTRRRH